MKNKYITIIININLFLFLTGCAGVSQYNEPDLEYDNYLKNSKNEIDWSKRESITHSKIDNIVINQMESKKPSTMIFNTPKGFSKQELRGNDYRNQLNNYEILTNKRFNNEINKNRIDFTKVSRIDFNKTEKINFNDPEYINFNNIKQENVVLNSLNTKKRNVISENFYKEEIINQNKKESNFSKGLKNFGVGVKNLIFSPGKTVVKFLYPTIDGNIDEYNEDKFKKIVGKQYNRPIDEYVK